MIRREADFIEVERGCTLANTQSLSPDPARALIVPWRDKPSRQRSTLLLMGVWLAANMLNTITTVHGFSRGFIEIAPVPAWALERGGPIALWGLKLVMVLAFPLALSRGLELGVFSHRNVRLALAVTCLAVVGVVLWEAWLLGWSPWA
jgi:hypothetical protein